MKTAVAESNQIYSWSAYAYLHV